MLTLYFNWNAVCALKVVLCMAEKGLSWSPHHLVLGEFEQLQPWYLKINPAGVVPTLVHDDVTLAESTIINEYLDDAFPDIRLRPTDPAGLASMRWWNKQIDDVIHPSIRPISFTQFVAPRAATLSREDLESMERRTPKREIAALWRRAAEAPYDEAELGAYLTKIEALFGKMETTLSSKPWLAGNDISLADIGMAPYFRRLIQLRKQAIWLKLPAVTEWWQKISARPSFAILDQLRAQYAPPNHPAAL